MDHAKGAWTVKEKRCCVVVTFHTTAEAMATELLCGEKGFTGRLISAPRALSADCGIAWCGPCETRGELVAALKAAQIETAGVHELEL